MKAQRSLHPTRHAGYGLVEMMITLTIMTVVLGVVFFALNRSQRQTTRLTNVAEERQMARTAIQLLEREARMAGSGWGRTAINGNGFTLHAINPKFGGLAKSDSLTMVGAWQANTTLTAAMTTSSTAFTVSNATGFKANDLVLITDKDGRTADLFQVTSINASVISHATSSSYNDAGGRSNFPPSGGYPAGSPLYKVTMSTYYFDSTTYHRPALMRSEVGQSPQIVAYNVNGFHVWYQLQDGSWTRNPTDLSLIDEVVPSVLTRVTATRMPTLTDSVWAAVRPRTF